MESDEGFAAWMAARQPRLLRTAYLLCGDAHTAEDLTQTALAKVYLAWDRLRDQDDLDAYSRRVLVNEHVSLWRRAWRRRELSVEMLPERAASPPTYDAVETVMWQHLLNLPRRQRAVVVLRYYEQLSVHEVAEALGISEGTVKSQCSRALSKLRGDLADINQEESWTT